ncbi:YDG domain-containing protein [Pseudorhodoferax sp.]|uniref:YDG domain-containing protein n=1 Tax=Pseudorhodoferax sp. TaxID=1993553 RepID=UPI0039E2283D
MNRIYRKVWSRRLGAFVAVAETARSRGKSAGAACLVLAGTTALAAGPAATALPTGGQVTAGSAAIAQQGSAMTVTQGSQRAAINWQGFSIGKDASVRFQQPNAQAVVLNRVTGAQASVIDGALQANGQVFVLNPNGVLFGKGARVDTAGLVASTRGLSDADFMAGKTTFSGSGAGSVVNEGTLNAADGGYVALIGQQVRNDGVISAKLGHVALAAGNQVTLNFNGSTLVGVTIEQGALDSLVANGGAILADGGEVLLTAKAAEGLLDGMVNHSGEIRARSIAEHEGKIVLLGDMERGTTTVSGTLDASAPDGANGVNGGFIETSAAKVKVADGARITTAAAQGRTGTWLIDPNDYTIAASGGDISGAALAAQLAGNNVVIQSTTGSNINGNGDIFVNDAVNWSANSRLMLYADRNIYINKPITATGASGHLLLAPGMATNNGVVGGQTSDYYVNAPISLQAGQNFSTQLGYANYTRTYTVVNSLGALGSTSATDLIGALSGSTAIPYLALGANLDASNIAFTNSVAGSNTPTVFAGLGHKISNIDIAVGQGPSAAFFGGSRGNLTVRDLRLDNVNAHDNFSATYYSSALVAQATGPVWISGVSVSNLSLSGSGYAPGGLVGYVNNGGSVNIVRSSVQGTVSGVVAGGLVANALGAVYVADSYARVNVSASGLVQGSTGQLYAGGGLVGQAGANITIERSYHVGSVPGGAGSLVGVVPPVVSPTIKVTDSFWDGSVVGAATVAVGSVGGSAPITITRGGSRTTAQMTNPTTFTGAGWDFGPTGPWLHKSTLNDGYPVLKAPWTTTTSLLLSLSSPLSMTYGDTVPVLTGLSLTGCGNCLTVNWGAALSSTTPAGSYAYASTPNIFSLNWASGINPSDYDVTLPTGFFTVDPRALTLAVNSGATRAYDGSALAAASLFNLAGTVNGDSVSLGGAATLDSLHAGTRTVAGIGGLTLNSSNYTLGNSVPSGTVEVSKAAVTANLSVAPRAYDGTTSASVTASPVGGVAGDTLSFTGVTGVLDSADAGNRTASVDVAGLSVTGVGLPSDYDFTAITGQPVPTTVTPKALTLSGATVAAKVYDGSTAGSATGGALSGLVGNETLVFTPTVTFTSANAGATAQVGATLADGTNGGKAGNYSVTLAADGTAITPRVVQAGKTYDGSSTFAGTDLVVQNLVAGDIVTATGSGILSGAGAGTQTLASAGTLSLNNGNYTLNGSSYLVLPRPVSLATLAGASKVYDGGTDVGSTLLQITNIAFGDTLSLSGSGSLAASGVGSRALVGVTGLTLTGAHAGNYTLVGATPSGSVTVTARPVSVVAVAGASKVYDGNTDAGSTLLQLGNLVGSDSVSLSGQASLAGANVGTQAITGLTGLALAGVDAGNYTLMGATPSGSVTVTARPVSIAGIAGASKVYDGSTDAGSALLQITNIAGNDSVGLAGNASLAGANAGTQALTGLTGLALTGAAAGNYTLVGSTPGGSVTITARPVSIASIAGASKVYDGSTDAGSTLLQITNLVAGESVGLSGQASLAGANVGTQAIAGLTGLTLVGVDAGNYTLVGSTPGGSVTITARPVSIASIAGASKVYDGSTDAGSTLLQITNLVPGDSVAVGGSATLAGANAGTQAIAGLAGLTLVGANAGNYTLVGSTPTGSVTITARPVSVSAAPGASRAYDGTALAGAELLQLSGVLPGEQAGLTGSAALSGKGVGTQALSAGTLALGNPNYVLAGGPSGSVTITPRVLLVHFTVADKVFDGTLGASVQATDDRVAGDRFGVDYTAAFADTTAGRGKPVAITGLGLSGPDAGNYQLAGGAGQGVTGNLVPRPLTYTLASTAPDKLYMADGTDLVTTAQLDQLVLQSWANTVAGTAPGALAYTIWKDGRQVDAIRDAGLYEIRAQFAAQDAHYAIADAGNTVLRIAVQDNAIREVVAQAVRTQPATPQASVPPGSGAPASKAPTLVNVPPAIVSAFSPGAPLALALAPTQDEPTATVTLGQARAMAIAGSGAGRDVRVPVSRNSLAEIVNGGVRLPTGVDQLLFVVQSEQ